MSMSHVKILRHCLKLNEIMILNHDLKNVHFYIQLMRIISQLYLPTNPEAKHTITRIISEETKVAHEIEHKIKCTFTKIKLLKPFKLSEHCT